MTILIFKIAPRFQNQSPVDVENIQYVSRLLRKLAQNKGHDNARSINHDEEIKKNFWAYAKSHLDSADYLIRSI